MIELNQKEIAVINNLVKRSSISQRELSRETGLSLGFINIILKKLIHTGFIQITHLHKRKLQYLLTPQGIKAAIKRTYQFTSSTIRNYKNLQENLTALINDLNASGYHYFSIYGEGDIREVIEDIFLNFFQETALTLGNEHKAAPYSIVLNITIDSKPENFPGNVINIMEKMGEACSNTGT